MTIKRLSKKQDMKEADSNVEKLTEEFIGSGGKTTSETGSTKSRNNDEIRFTLRIPKSMIRDIDQRKKSLPGSVSRNTWILQLISEKLASE